jgi:DNA-binding NtrC family response regulator
MRIQKILLIDDEPVMRRTLNQTLSKEGYQILCLSSIAQAEEIAKKETFDLVLCDMVLPDGNGLELLRRLRQNYPRMQAILMTGYASAETAVEAIRIGLFDYLVKPVTPAQLEFSLQRLQAYEQLSSENDYLRQQFDMVQPSAPELWGRSTVMKEILELARRVAQTQATVLIQGESGTGKELLARYIWQHSKRLQSPFIKINCAAVPEQLLESEFFGHERGAFTGAETRREGRFETAHGGTLLLDEIAEIPLGLQTKLLRVLQERSFERLGGNNTLHVDVRIIASTNRDLTEEVRLGRFREDLYYRLNVVPITLPPLRLRGEDVDELANFFIAHFARRHGRDVKGLTEAAWHKIHGYHWPGNVRELQNTLERAVIMATPQAPDFYMDVPDFALPNLNSNGDPTPVLTPDSSTFIAQTDGQLPTVSEMERRLIAAALIQTHNNRTHAAKRIGISLRTLRNKLRDYRTAGFDTTHPETWLT